MKVAFVLVSLFVSVAFSSVKEGVKICESLILQGYKNQCLLDVSSYQFFDRKASGVCLSMDFDLERYNCALVIGDKSYTTREIKTCKGFDFASEKTSCLKKLGRYSN